MFGNARRDTLVLYFADGDSEETLQKKLAKGAFLLPAPDGTGAQLVVLRRSMLHRLFRS